MIFNRRNNGAEELRMVTCSFYANADFTKIASMVATVQTEVAKIVGADVMGAIEAAYEQGERCGTSDLMTSVMRPTGAR